MLRSISIGNFRSIEKQYLPLSRINIIYGGTATGKSSALYAPFIIKNFLRAPNQPLPVLFNLGFINLGGFESCVFNYDFSKEIFINIKVENGTFELRIGRNTCKTRLMVDNLIDMQTTFTLPYTANQNQTYNLKYGNQDFVINWNGIHANVTPKIQTTASQQTAHNLSIKINSIVSELNKVDIVPLRRGFFQPLYSSSSVPAQQFLIPWTDADVASTIIMDSNLPIKIALDLEFITGRDFRIHIPPGTPSAYFKTADKSSRVPTDLVNDGFGINQIVYMLAKIHRAEVKTIFIEEPEIHLHPSIIGKLVERLILISKEDDKQFLIVTHSEIFIFSMLKAVSKGVLDAEELNIFYTYKDGRKTIFELQKPNKYGQIEGGLKKFIDTELEILEDFLAVKKDEKKSSNGDSS